MTQTVTRQRRELSQEEIFERRLRRSAVEPSRVFAFSDFNDERNPVEHVNLEGGDWFAPYGWPYAFKGSNCKVLDRAIRQWGAVTRTDLTEAVQWIVNANPLERDVRLDSPVEFSYEPDRWHKKGLTVPAIVLPEGGFLPATPVYYTLRRFGLGGRWQRLWRDPGTYRYDLPDEGPVAMVSVVRPPTTQ